MELSVQWFIAAVIENHILPVDVCKKLIDASGDNVELVALAQKIIDDGLCRDVDRIQSIAEYAYNQAGSGQAPATVFSIDNQIPSLDNLSGFSDPELRKLMLQMLNAICRLEASDLHLSANAVPFLRLNLKVEKFGRNVLMEPSSLRLKIMMRRMFGQYFRTSANAGCTTQSISTSAMRTPAPRTPTSQAAKALMPRGVVALEPAPRPFKYPCLSE